MEYTDDDEEDEKNKEDEEWIKNVVVDKEDIIFHKVIMYFFRGKIQFRSKTFLWKSDGKIVDLRKNGRLGRDLLLGILHKESKNFLVRTGMDSQKKLSN